MFVSLCLQSLIWELGMSLFFPNLIQVTESHQCHCHCHPGTSQHFPAISCHVAAARAWGRAIRPSVHQLVQTEELETIWAAGMEYLEEFVAVNFSSVPEGGYGRGGSCVQRTARCLEGFCSRHPLSGHQGEINYWSFKGFSSPRAVRERVLSTCGNSSPGPAAVTGSWLGPQQLRMPGTECHSCPALQESCTQPWQELAAPQPCLGVETPAVLLPGAEEPQLWVWVLNHPWDWRSVSSGTGSSLFLEHGGWSCTLRHPSGVAGGSGLALAQSFYYHSIACTACPGTWLLLLLPPRALPLPSTLFFHCCVFLKGVYRFF